VKEFIKEEIFREGLRKREKGKGLTHLGSNSERQHNGESLSETGGERNKGTIRKIKKWGKKLIHVYQ